MPSISEPLWIMEQAVGIGLQSGDCWKGIGPPAQLDKLGMSKGVDNSTPFRSLMLRLRGGMWSYGKR